MRQKINVAIDGPAGAGKSTIAKLLAEQLQFVYIDTGAMYRALTYFAIQNQIDLNNGKSLAAALDRCSIRLAYEKNGLQIFVNDQNVSEEIRTDLISNNVSKVASHKDVRQKMLQLQQQLARGGGTVMDGRDIGTHVLPNAEVKIFLTASTDERARRRHEENIQKGYDSDFEKIKEDIVRRDEMDITRKEAPLKKAADAIEIDSTHLTIDEVVRKILHIIEERVK